MTETTRTLLCALLIGAGATVVMDIWAIVRQRLLGVPPLDYRLVGRWFGHLVRGRVRHRPIGSSAPIAGERMIDPGIGQWRGGFMRQQRRTITGRH